MSNSTDKTAGIVVTHGRLAAELIRTIAGILGEVDDLYSVCSEDNSDSTIVEIIKDVMGRYKGEDIVLFVDYSGGSCFFNCIRAKVGMNAKEVKVVSGVNLPILLDFVTKRNVMNYEDMINHLIKRGQDSINTTS